MKTNEVVIEQYHMVLNREQLRIIAAGLNELPYRVSASLLAELQRQVDAEERRQAKEAAERELAGIAQTKEPPLNKGFVKQPGD